MCARAYGSILILLFFFKSYSFAQKNSQDTNTNSSVIDVEDSSEQDLKNLQKDFSELGKNSKE